jgi:hypothetical protein
MNSKEFAELHAKRWETLKRHAHEADRMCELFGQCLPEPSASQIRSDIVEQRIRRKRCLRGLRRDSPPTVKGGADRLWSGELNHYRNVPKFAVSGTWGNCRSPIPPIIAERAGALGSPHLPGHLVGAPGVNMRMALNGAGCATCSPKRN